MLLQKMTSQYVRMEKNSSNPLRRLWLVNIRRNTCMDVLDVLETLSIVVCHL